jgi:hypothetical protein
VDFVDNPALLVDVSLCGRVSIETKDGMIRAALAGVTGAVCDQDKQAFDHVVSSAMRDVVAFRVRADKTLDIWYQDADGETRSLNRDVASVFTEIHE